MYHCGIKLPPSSHTSQVITDTATFPIPLLVCVLSLYIYFVVIKLVTLVTIHASTAKLLPAFEKQIYESRYIQKYARFEVLTAVFLKLK